MGGIVIGIKFSQEVLRERRKNNTGILDNTLGNDDFEKWLHSRTHYAATYSFKSIYNDAMSTNLGLTMFKVDTITP